MTSAERHEARYQRRRVRRTQKLIERQKSFEEVFSFGHLVRSGRKCCNGVRWKTSTILFETFLLQEAWRTLKEFRTGRRSFRGFHSFKLTEHGKTRAIDALPIRYRAAQKCFCKYFLYDVYSPSFVYDNGASLPQKGMDFSLKRMRKHLREHSKRHGLEGGIYQYDFKSYFSSIPHSEIKESARKRIFDRRLLLIFFQWIDDFQLLQTARAGEHRGVGLGSEISQLIALDYAGRLDHYFKDACGIRGYGRYMDDGYVISDSVDRLKHLMADAYKISGALGLRMSDKKNTIKKFQHHGFSFLKMRTRLHGENVTMKISRNGIRSVRRKLSIFRRWVTEGRMGAEDVFASYQSWRAHARRAQSYDTLQAIDERFADMFKKELGARRLRFPCTMIAVKGSDGWEYHRRNMGRKGIRWNILHITRTAG